MAALPVRARLVDPAGDPAGARAVRGVRVCSPSPPRSACCCSARRSPWSAGETGAVIGFAARLDRRRSDRGGWAVRYAQRPEAAEGPEHGVRRGGRLRRSGLGQRPLPAHQPAARPVHPERLLRHRGHRCLRGHRLDHLARLDRLPAARLGRPAPDGDGDGVGGARAGAGDPSVQAGLGGAPLRGGLAGRRRGRDPDPRARAAGLGPRVRPDARPGADPAARAWRCSASAG